MDLSQIISDRAIITHYQPLVSIRRKRILGFEALSRGMGPDGEVANPPLELFAMAREQGLDLELDRLCRDVALEGFSELYSKRKDVLISLNLDTAVLDSGAAGSNYLKHQAEQWGIEPNNILIEILESRVTNERELQRFVETYRGYGFLIGMDDVGVGHSNLERIARLKPDVIKLDRALIKDIDKEFYKREVAAAMIKLSGQLGALCLAEGVERREEASLLLELGVDVFQGYFFARPAPLHQGSNGVIGRINEAARVYEKCILDKIEARKRLFASLDHLLNMVLDKVRSCPPGALGQKLTEAITETAKLECAYIINEDGIQEGDTVCNPFTVSEHKRFIYQPADEGADHSLKNYFLPLKAGLDRFTTESYISLASGNVCTTMSAWFEAGDARRRVLCLDISQEEEGRDELRFSSCS